jgi:decaprenylphospho-beta-D-ribofuranose 2-oxidase
LYSVGWIDALASGANLGRGILETAEHAPEGVAESQATRWNLPFELPGFVLNAHCVQAFNAIYYRRVPATGRQRRVHLRKFLYPLDAIGHWNRLYGRRGFFQFQCVVPDAEAPAALRRLLEAVSAGRASSFLAVLKTLGDAGPGMLSFPIRGYTLALDIPNHGAVRALLARLEAITLDHRGRVYLAKDAALSEPGFRRMYPRVDEFRRTLERIDPKGRMMSDMARRLGLRACVPQAENADRECAPQALQREVDRAIQIHAAGTVAPAHSFERH